MRGETRMPTSLMRLGLFAGCWLACGLALAEEQASSPDWAELGDRLSAVEAENARLRSIVDHACPCEPEVGQPSLQFKGRIHVDLWGFPGDSPGVNAFDSGNANVSPQDRLELRRARFEAFGTLPGGIAYALDFELSEAADPEFRDLYIGWSDVPLIGTIRLGNQKRPYGLDHLNSSNFMVFLERPFVVQAFNRNNRRFGLAAYGVSEDEAWNWRWGVFNLRELQTDGVYVSDHYQLEAAGRLARTWDLGGDSSSVHSAIAGNYAQPDGVPAPGREQNQARFRTEPEARTKTAWLDTGVIDGAEAFGILGLESVVNHGQLQVAAEYLNLWLDRRAGFGDSLHFHGGYLQVAYFLTPHYQPWNRQLGTISRVEPLDGPWRPAWQVAFRWSFADLSSDDIRGGVGESVAVAANWYWTPRARLQFNCLYGEIRDRFPVDGQTAGTYTSLGTRIMVDF